MTRRSLSQGLPLILVLLVSMGCAFFWCAQKAGLSLDEVYSYGLSNSDGAPFINRLYDDGITGHIVPRDTLQSYVSVTPGEAFDYASVYYNQTQDVHPPLFYFLLHTVCSFFPGRFSIWFGLALNLALYGGTVILIYLMAQAISESAGTAALSCLVYSLSQAGLSTMLMVRMYMLLTFLSTLLTYLVVTNARHHYKAFLPAVFLTMYAGMMTQYFFIIYSVLLCIAYGIFLLWHKDRRTFLGFLAASVMGVVTMLVTFPSWWHQLHSQQNVSLDTVTTNASAAMAQQLGRIASLLEQLVLGMPLAIVLFVLGLLVMAVLLLKRRTKDIRQLPSTFLVIAIPLAISFAIVAVVSPYLVLRYAYQLLPLVSVVACTLLWCACGHLRNALRVTGAVVVAAIALALGLSQTPGYLCLEYRDLDARLEPYAHDECAYITGNSNPSITSDLWHLLQFDDVCVVDEPTDATLAGYDRTRQSSGMLVFISSYPVGRDEQAVLDSLCSTYGFSGVENLSSGDLSDIYYLHR